MVIYDNGSKKDSFPLDNNDMVVCFANEAERAHALEHLSIDAIKPHGGTRFENHRGVDYMSINVPAHTSSLSQSTSYELFFTGKVLVIVSAVSPLIESIIAELDGGEAAQPANVLHMFFVMLTEHDMGALEEIEEEIEGLEESLTNEVDIEYNEIIGRLRKRIFILKRYYEPLYALMEDLCENQNDLLGQEDVRLFGFQAGRAERLYNTVLNLRDYVTQVRESYQAQMDISLNKTMRLFTVITTIFLPLTLIAGWYGMNLKMPEYSNYYAYPVVIVVSLLVVVGSIVYFKKRKWF